MLCHSGGFGSLLHKDICSPEDEGQSPVVESWGHIPQPHLNPSWVSGTYERTTEASGQVWRAIVPRSRKTATFMQDAIFAVK